ncbi:MAG: 3D-(3,5/4)-trihydroxycyclohexane-1,2-dione acylhydrolase (decyclizing), partial [Clostridia bacterium]|nr:3D-(3,5/4)-trihydroxycyclohexane-1,2-dione acylhydrolase (decyclizing) [Clostridia bacterium]
EIMPLDFAKNAEGYGLKAYSIRTEEELLAALEDALTQERPVLYDIKVLPGSMTPGYESWWRVGVAEVSTQPKVQAAYESLTEHVKDTRKF